MLSIHRYNMFTRAAYVGALSETDDGELICKKGNCKHNMDCMYTTSIHKQSTLEYDTHTRKFLPFSLQAHGSVSGQGYFFSL